MSRRYKIAIQALMGIALLFCIGATLTFLHARIYTILDADEASQLVLAKLLSEEGSLLSTRWLYGNELRILDVQIVNSLLFRITDNWHAVRFASCTIHLLLLLGMYFVLCKAAGIADLYSCSALIFAVPFSETYFLYAQIGSYIPHFLFSFGIWAVLFRYIDLKERRRNGKFLADASSGNRKTKVLPLLAVLIALTAAALGECVTNCVRHAKGSRVTVAINEESGVYTVTITNDGEAPGGPIIEGGGLGSLRRRVESAGGGMKISHYPAFALILKLKESRG